MLNDAFSSEWTAEPSMLLISVGYSDDAAERARPAPSVAQKATSLHAFTEYTQSWTPPWVSSAADECALCESESHSPASPWNSPTPDVSAVASRLCALCST